MFYRRPIGVKLRHDVGIDNIAWECDYPHSDSSWPNAGEEFSEVAREIPDDEINKITHENAMRWYSFDPFVQIPKTEATVKALRAKSPDHDVSERAFDTGRREKHVGIEVGKINATA